MRIGLGSWLYLADFFNTHFGPRKRNGAAIANRRRATGLRNGTKDARVGGRFRATLKRCDGRSRKYNILLTGQRARLMVGDKPLGQTLHIDYFFDGWR